MLKGSKLKTNVGIGAGWVTLLVGSSMARAPSSSHPMLAIAVLVVGAAFFIWGCAQYSKGKGHSAYWGALGLLWIFGLVVLFFFKDRNKEPQNA